MSLRPFTVHEGIAAPLLRDNIDTDAIIPSREVTRVSKEGLGGSLFAQWRYEHRGGMRGEERPEFVLNAGPYRDASILLTGANFGCGSSREYAVWALREFGIRAIFAPSFGAIFQSNCVNNGLLAVPLAARSIKTLADYVASDPAHRRLRVDLEACRVSAGEGLDFEFAIDPSARRRLLGGIDNIDQTLRLADDIARFKARHDRARPWAALGNKVS